MNAVKQIECFLSLNSGEEAILYHWKTVVTTSHLTPNELPISETRHSLTSYEGKCVRVFCHATKKKCFSCWELPLLTWICTFAKPSNVSPHLFPPQDACRLTPFRTMLSRRKSTNDTFGWCFVEAIAVTYGDWCYCPEMLEFTMFQSYATLLLNVFGACLSTQPAHNVFVQHLYRSLCL